MKKSVVGLLFFSCIMLALPYNADAYIQRNTAIVRVMNKAAGKAQTVIAPVGKTTNLEKLSILIRDCKQTDPFQAENFFAFAEISKAAEGKIFSGWMNRNEPGNNPVQHPDYDVWLVKCE